MSNEFKVKGNYLTSSYLKKFSLILFALLFVFSISNLHATGKKLWSYHPGTGFVDTSPAVGDLDGDGVKDLVFCTVTGRVLALNSLGLRIWYHDVKEPISTPPVIADLNNDGALEVLVLTNNGNIVCLDGLSGKFLWHYRLPSSITWGTTSLAVSDLLNSGRNEIVAADNAGNLVCLKGDGSVQWSKKFKDKFNTAPAIGQLTEKGEKNILIGSDLSPLICLSPNGKELWRVNGEKSSGSSPLIGDIDGDKIPEILVGTGKDFTLFNNAGKKLWSYKMRGEIHDAISFGDLYNDHKMEIIVADLIGDVVALSNMGKALWTSNVTQRVRRSATIADIDGDSKPEVLVAGYSSVLYVYNSDGSLKDQIPLKGPMNGSPTVVDFRDNGNLTVVCGANSEILAFNWHNQNHNSNYIIPFAGYRCNSLRTGGILKENNTIAKANMEVDFGDVFVGDNVFKAIVHNPGKKHLDLKLKIKKDDIENEGEISSSDTLFSQEVNYTISGTNALNFKFSTILSENGKTIIQKERSFYVVPFAKDIADLKDKLAAVQSLNSDNHDSNQYVSDQLIVFSHRLHEIEEKVSVAGTLPLLELSDLKNSVSLLRKAITIFYKMSMASQDAANGFAAYSANPWAPFGGVDEIVENRIPKAQVSIEAFMGETQSAAINIANFEGKSLTFRIEPLSLVSEKDSTKVLAKDVYELHEVLDVPTQAMDYSADALPLLNQAQTLLIPQRDVRQLWINVNTKVLSPGTWKGIIRLHSLEVEAKQIDIPVTIKVWQNALPQKQPVRLCLWGFVNSSYLKDYPEEALRDKVSHGTNVFVEPPEFDPVAKFDNEGNIVGNIDFSKHDEFVKTHIKDGLILFLAYQAGLRGPAAQFTPVWEKAHKSWLKAWIAHLKDMGITYDQYAFYPVDEPGLNNGVDLLIDYGKSIRDADPKAQIYADPVGAASMDDLKRIAPYVDIWCPNRSGYLLNEGQDKLAYLKSTGKPIWTYECIGNAKHLSPIGYYRSQAWLSWHYGLTGMGFWTYCTSSDDPWFMPGGIYPNGTYDYLLIYEGKGVVSSKRWEAIHDGVEDYGMLNELKNAVAMSKDNSTLKFKEEANQLLKDDVFEIARYCGLDKYGMEPGLGGMKEYRQVEDTRWEKIKEVRRKIARLLIELK